MAPDETTLPDIGQVLAPILAAVPVERRPLLIAIAERLAARRYRAWADEPALAAHARALRACADREEAIADRVEALHPDASGIERDLLAANPQLETVNRTLFEGRPLPDQLTIQARGERLGAATWRSFARTEPDPKRRDVLLACATLEEDSARVLESITGRPQTA
jgi:hypothetical protein